MESAPRDGRWLLLDVDDGSTDCCDYPVSCVYVGRWNPKVYPDLGEHSYEWEVIDRYPDSPDATADILTHWSAGRVTGWLPFPSALSR
jgi:hypothetical protein